MHVPEITSPLEPLRKCPEPPKHKRAWLITSCLVVIAFALTGGLWLSLSHGCTPTDGATEQSEPVSKPDRVSLSKQSTTEVKLATASSETPSQSFLVAATVEPNPQQVQQVTPLVSGRVQKILVSLGDKVKKGQLLVRIDSPEVAELHGKLHEAETRLKLARVNLDRVKASANQVAILKAKATLDEAEATNKRTEQLVEEGLTARKDLVASTSALERAKADYNFQKDISLNREVAEAQAELSTAQTEVGHLRDGLRALDAELTNEKAGSHDISIIELHSPIAGTVIERFVNPGAGFDKGKPLITIANTSSLWVVASVPERHLTAIREGSPARVILDGRSITGKVSYIDPRLNEDTRTARVRIEIQNPDQQIPVGSFVQVEFKQSVASKAGVFVPESAVQTVDGNCVVFRAQDSGSFSLQQVEAGTAVGGKVPIISGLTVGDRVASDGSFVLKSKLLSEQFKDED